MDINEIKNLIDELKQQINYHNNKYYVEDTPEIEDYEYDMLLRKLETLEAQYPELTTSDSPTQNVGGSATAKFKPVVHSVRMESLHDSFSYEELRNFDKKIKSQIENIDYVIEPKIDGLSVSAEYMNGLFVRGSTRGDGDVGEDITENLRTIKTLPMQLAENIPYLEVRGEVYMSKENFLKLTENQKINDKKIFKNPRNAAAGSLRQKSANVTKKRNLDIIIFNIQKIEGKSLYDHKNSLKYLKKLGFNVVPYSKKFVNNIEDSIKEIEYFEHFRDKFDFAIDGAVVKVNLFEHRKKLGSTSKYPKWAEAFKYPPEKKETKLLKIEVNVGRTGILTPVAVFEPILLAGTIVGKAILHNEKLIKDKKIQLGDTIIVRKAGEIIPEVVGIKNHNADSTLFKMPINCPSCNSKIVREDNGFTLRCTNSQCPAQLLRHLIHFVSRDAMDITGLGPSLLVKLTKNKLVKSYADIYKLTLENVINLEKMGKKSAENLIKSINESKNREFYRLIHALGIRDIGKNAAKLFTNKFVNLEQIFNASIEDIMQIDGFGPAMAKNIINYFSVEQNKIELNELKMLGLNTQTNIFENINNNLIFKDKIFVLTGTLSGLTRKQAINIIEKFGGKVVNSVSKKTNFVLFGNNSGSKLTKANELGIKVISESEFLDLCKK